MHRSIHRNYHKGLHNAHIQMHMVTDINRSKHNSALKDFHVMVMAQPYFITTPLHVTPTSKIVTFQKAGELKELQINTGHTALRRKI